MGQGLDESGNKIYEMNCEDCRELQNEMIQTDRKHWKDEIEKMLDQKLSTHVNIIKSQKLQFNWLSALTIADIAIIVAVIYLIFER